MSYTFRSLACHPSPVINKFGSFLQPSFWFSQRSEVLIGERALVTPEKALARGSRERVESFGFLHYLTLG